MELKIEYIPIEKIKPYENNVKVHTKSQHNSDVNTLQVIFIVI